MNGTIKPSYYCSNEILQLFKNRALTDTALLEKLKIVPRRMLDFLAQTIQDAVWFQEHSLFLKKVFREITVLTLEGKLKLSEVEKTFGAIIRFEPKLFSQCIDNDTRFEDSQFTCSRLMLMQNGTRFVKDAPPASIKEMFPYLTKRQMGLYYRSYQELDLTFLYQEPTKGLWAYAKQFNLDQNKVYLQIVEKHLISVVKDITTAFEFFPLAVKLKLKELEQHIIRFICSFRGVFKGSDSSYVFHVRGADSDRILETTLKAINEHKKGIPDEPSGLDLLTLKVYIAKGRNWKSFYEGAANKDENRLMIEHRQNAFMGVTHVGMMDDEPLNLHNIQSVEVIPGASGKIFSHILLGVLYFLTGLRRLSFNQGEFLTDSLLKKIAYVKRIDHKIRLGEKIECLELGKVSFSKQTWESLPSFFPHVDLIKISDITWPNHLLERLLKLEYMQYLVLKNITHMESFCEIPLGAFKKLKVLCIYNVKNLNRQDIKRVLIEAEELILLNVNRLENDVFFLSDFPEKSGLKILITNVSVFKDLEDIEKLSKIESLEKVVFKQANSPSGKQKELLEAFIRSTRANVSIELDEDEPIAPSLFQSV